MSFGLLLNLVAVANAEDKAGGARAFLKRYAPDASPETHPRLDALVGYAIRYFTDFVKPAKTIAPADEFETGALQALDSALAALPAEASAEDIQSVVYEVGRSVPRYQDLKAKGATPERPGVAHGLVPGDLSGAARRAARPRFGSFAAIYGIDQHPCADRQGVVPGPSWPSTPASCKGAEAEGYWLAQMIRATKLTSGQRQHAVRVVRVEG